jgi:LysR family glycine cleavage system transcriptional activator
MQTLSYESLRCFAEAARVLSFRSAARAVALSPAALGQRIRQLEEELGTPLFHRTTRTVVLSEAGLRLLPHAIEALARVDACREAVVDGFSPPLDLTIGTRHELGMSWLVPAVGPIEKSWPGLTLHLYVGSGEDLVVRVRSLAIDCAVTSTRVVDPRLASLPLHEERYVFVGSRALLARHPLKNAVQARAHTLFDTTDELPLFSYLRDAGGSIDSTDFRSVVRMGAIDLIRAFVREGRGVAILPLYFIAKDLERKALVPVLPRLAPRSDWFRLVFRADDPRRSVFERLADTLRRRRLR